MPLFTIVIPTYNRTATLPAALASIRAQDFKDYETIVVDDGSTDGTVDWLSKCPDITLVRQVNRGPGIARNIGVAESSGEYIAFLDSDDIWFPWTLSTYAAAIEIHGRPDFVSGQLEPFWQDKDLKQIKRQPLLVETFTDYYQSSRKSYYVGACMMVLRRNAFQSVGGFTGDPVYAEDCELALKLGLAKGFVQILAPATVGYRQHSLNARLDFGRMFGGISNLIRIERHGKFPGGHARQRDRIKIITLHVRPFSMECLCKGKQQHGWRLYFETFLWHLRLCRWKYLLGFPICALSAALGIWCNSEGKEDGMNNT